MTVNMSIHIELTRRVCAVAKPVRERWPTKRPFQCLMKQLLTPSASIFESSTDVLDVTVNDQVEERVK